MGFYVPGEIAFLCDIALPQVGVITNIGTVHAERAGSQEAIAQGKAELVQALPPAPQGVAILNYDDPWVREMAEKTAARVFFYGMDPQADLWADHSRRSGAGGDPFPAALPQRSALPEGPVDRAAFGAYRITGGCGWPGGRPDLAGDRGWLAFTGMPSFAW